MDGDICAWVSISNQRRQAEIKIGERRRRGFEAETKYACYSKQRNMLERGINGDKSSMQSRRWQLTRGDRKGKEEEEDRFSLALYVTPVCAPVTYCTVIRQHRSRIRYLSKKIREF